MVRHNNNLKIYKFDENISITSFSTMYVYNFSKNYLGIIESHRQYELVLVNKGSMITVEDGIEYCLKAGEAFLHKPNSVHQDKNNGCASQVSIMSFLSSSNDLQLLFDQLIKLNNGQLFMINNIFNYVSRHIKPTDQFWFSGQKNMISENIPYGFLQIIKNQLELFFISLIETKAEKTIENQNVYTPLSNKIIEILEANVYQKFDLEKLANQLNYSKNYLCRHFKNNTGFTINDFFNNLKIKESKQLLIETEYNLNQISELLGFETVQYFSYWFKKNVGISPFIFRKNVQRERFY